MDLTTLDPPSLRTLLPPFVSGYIADAEVAAHNRARVSELVGTWSDEQVAQLLDTLTSLGEEHRLYLADPAGRELTRVWTRDVLTATELVGVEHLATAAASGPTVVLCNHLSYLDSTAIDAVLAHAGHAELADRLVSVAGPKVYADLFRRVASCTLNTLPVPQSASVAHAEQLSRRELARRAIASLRAGQSALQDGWVLLIFPEGSRSRSTRLGSFLKGVHRYLVPDSLVVPAALSGTQHVMPIGDTRLHPGPVRLTLGAPLRVDAEANALEVLTAAHDAVAALLPDDQKPRGDAAPIA